ncbi:MAG: substrate-binding domain-containing protein [Verrucomicrobiota bacterium]
MTNPLRRQPLVEQTAAHLRAGLQSGRWVGHLPGVPQLVKELVVSNHVIRAALGVLEKEGWIEDCGVGRRRRIVPQPHATPVHRTLRIGIMLYVPLVEDDVPTISILLNVRHEIERAGHICVFSDQCLTQMKDNLTRISRCVKTASADAWIVFGGSRPVLEWFAAQPFPVFAYGGRFHNLPVASSATRGAPAIESAVNALVEHGHRRIVLLAETILRKPTPIPSLENYLSFLEARGISATDYNLPHFENTVAGLESCLRGLFHITPPTALIVHHASQCVAVFSFLARRGLQVPHDVSVICMSMDLSFSLYVPPLDHFHMPTEKYITRITRWVGGVAKGRPDKDQVIFDAEYVPGGTVGRVKK